MFLVLQKNELYSEKNYFRRNPSFKFIQQVSYSGVAIDRQSEMFLLLEIVDQKGFQNKKAIDVKNDTTLLKCSWDFLSTWNLEEEKTSINGYINVLSWSKKEIELELIMEVVDLRKNRSYFYTGKRVFYKAAKKKKWDII